MLMVGTYWPNKYFYWKFCNRIISLCLIHSYYNIYRLKRNIIIKSVLLNWFFGVQNYVYDLYQLCFLSIKMYFSWFVSKLSFIWRSSEQINEKKTQKLNTKIAIVLRLWIIFITAHSSWEQLKKTFNKIENKIKMNLFQTCNFISIDLCKKVPSQSFGPFRLSK